MSNAQKGGTKADAFTTLLRASQKQQGGGSSAKGGAPPAKRPRTQQQYRTCPVCGATVPLAFLEIHVGTCLEGPASQPRPASQAGGRQAKGCGGSGGGGAAAAARKGGSTQGGAPPTPQTPAAAAAAAQAPSATPPSAAGAPAATQQQPWHPGPPGSATPAQARAASHTSAAATPAPLPALGSQLPGEPAGGATPGARNAFDVLARGQRMLQQVHVSYLERSPCGAFTVRWWLKGDRAAPQGAPARWAAPSPLNLGRGGGKGQGPTQVLLQTNVPSGDGVEVSWANAALASNAANAGGWRAAGAGAAGAGWQASQGAAPGPARQLSQGGGGGGGGGGGFVPAAAAAGAAAAAAAAVERGTPRKQMESIFKSSLQKNIRRGRVDAAVRWGGVRPRGRRGGGGRPRRSGGGALHAWACRVLRSHVPPSASPDLPSCPARQGRHRVLEGGGAGRGGNQGAALSSPTHALLQVKHTAGQARSASPLFRTPSPSCAASRSSCWRTPCCTRSCLSSCGPWQRRCAVLARARAEARKGGRLEAACWGCQSDA
jgi:hypothetical protein